MKEESGEAVMEESFKSERLESYRLRIRELQKETANTRKRVIYGVSCWRKVNRGENQNMMGSYL